MQRIVATKMSMRDLIDVRCESDPTRLEDPNDVPVKKVVHAEPVETKTVEEQVEVNFS